MKILLPVDGSDYTRRMLSYVAAHDELLGPGHEYLLLHVAAPIPSHATRFLEPHTINEHYRDAAEQVLNPLREFAEQRGWNVRIAHAHGHAADVIAAFAETEQSDLIVMGSHGYSALGILGSISMGVLARCKVPVLLIR